jgi:hypothetical protein
MACHGAAPVRCARLRFTKTAKYVAAARRTRGLALRAVRHTHDREVERQARIVSPAVKELPALHVSINHEARVIARDD